MYDTIRIGIIVADIDRYFKDLEKMEIMSAANLADEKTFYATSMLLFSILNRFIDLGGEMVTALQLGTPATYKDIFFLLTKQKVITLAIEKKCGMLVHDRNLLAHEYQEFTGKDVYEIFKRIIIVKDFVAIVKKMVKE